MECKSCLAIDWSSFHLCQHWLKCKHVLYNIGVTIYVSMNHNFEDPLTNKLSIYEQSHSWVTTAFSTLNSAIHLGTTSIRSILCVGPSSSIVSSFSSGQHDSEPWAMAAAHLLWWLWESGGPPVLHRTVSACQAWDLWRPSDPSCHCVFLGGWIYVKIYRKLGKPVS